MSAQLIDVSDGVVTIRVSGLLTAAELLASQKAAGQEIDKLGKASLLLQIEDFQGTAKNGDWGDLSFQMEYDDRIQRIAVVCEAKWQNDAFLFTGKGIRPVNIRHFLPTELAAAQKWAASGA